MKKIGWLLFAFFGIAVGLYPVVYFVVDVKFGLLAGKPETLRNNPFWATGFYSHIGGGGLALLLGWTQFHKKWRTRRPGLHRTIGKIYVLSALLSALAGFCIGFVATGGVIAQSGFVSLGAIWFFTTLSAYRDIKNGDIARHERMMIYSYAACFAAVTLRLWLPLLIWANQGDFLPAYRLVAWLCWVPNLAVAWWMVKGR